ncbi:MAG: GGDEF domain-containing protein [Candidatus Angelobacter sp. Gp1-AA117]|nr:MAG: GGDEF domain-containing protein [Candidatus Angelobacter sp. Gp1-AA117]
MTSRPVHLFFSSLMPGGLLFVAALLLTRYPLLPPSAYDVLPWLPYTIFAVGALLSWRFNRSRILWAMIVLTLMYGALSIYVLGRGNPSGTGATIFSAIALLLPVNLVIFSVMKERGTTFVTALLWIGLILGQLMIVAAVCQPELEVFARFLRHSFVHSRGIGLTRYSQPAFVAFALGFLVLVVRFIWSPKPLESGFFWTLMTLFLGMNAASTRQTTGLYFATAGLILLFSLIEMSYHMAFLDELTGLPGRRAFNEAALKLGESYALAMVDVDHFKNFNDTYGHECGDQVLSMIAVRLAAVTGGGKAFRYGGEEFAILFPELSARQAIVYLERLRHTIANTPFILRGTERRKSSKKSRSKARHKHPNEVQVTVSIGVANRNQRYEEFDQVTRAADRALYKAKESGRNCVKA